MSYKCAEYLHHKQKQISCVVSLDSGLPPAPPLIPASLSKPVQLGEVTYRVVEKRLDWTGALHLCESLNGTLATVKTPFEQAYLTLLINRLHRPAWISLYNYGVSLLTFIIIHRIRKTTAAKESRTVVKHFFLYSQGRSYTWLGEEEVLYSNWKDGEPNQMAGCGHMTTTGQWTMTPCDAKLEAALCQISGTYVCTSIKHAILHLSSVS